jgi:hypothetical protein
VAHRRGDYSIFCLCRRIGKRNDFDGHLPAQAGRWLAFAVTLTGGLLPSVDFFIINVSLPSISVSLGADPAELELVVSYARFAIYE